MAQKKNNTKKALIILCVLASAALIGFLAYDEVQSAGYLKSLNAATAVSKEIEAGTSTATTYNYSEGDRENASEAVRNALFVREEEGITFEEKTADKDGTVISDVYLSPEEYFFLGEDGKWERTAVEEKISARPYSIGSITANISSEQLKRIKKANVDGRDGYEVIYNRQWIMNSYQGQNGEPISGNAVYLLSEDGSFVEKVTQTLNIRVTDSEGNKVVKVIEETSEIAKGDAEAIKAQLDSFYKENIEGNYVEASEESEEESEESSESKEEATIGSSK